MQSNVIHASIIIDDPLLRENYGFLNYRKLLGLMDRHDFVTTIAFIPWNYNRTERRIANLFRERPDRFSLCVHGCDHTKAEFGTTDINYLNKLVRLATARMMEHERKTGVPFDKVMIFPQGIFSNEALEALKKNNYLAAVNTETMPVEGRISSEFPFFVRYTPEDFIHCNSDPAFIVLHHDYFKNGYERLTDFVDKLNGRAKNIEWDSLGNIIRHYISSEEIEIGPTDVDLSGWKFHGYKRNAKIFARRHASELRDNYLYKNEFLLNCVKKMKNLIMPG